MTDTKVLNNIKKSFELKSQGFYKPAIEMLYKALTIEPDNLEILAQLANLYKLLDNEERAIYYIEKVLEINKTHIDSLILLKDIYINQNELNKAKEILNKICEINPCAENIAQKVKILNELNEFDEIKKLENIFETPDDNLLYEFAVAYYNKKNVEKAIELLKTAVLKNPANKNVLELQAKIYYETKDFEKSKEIFEKLLKINPTAQTMNHLGLFSMQEQNFYTAVNYFTNGQKLDEKNSELSFNLASAYFMIGRLDEALKSFNLAICLKPQNLDYHYSLAYLYYHKKDYEKASKELKFIKSIEPEHHYSKVLDAMLAAQNGDLFEAKTALEAIINQNDSDDFAFYALSFVCKELNDYDAAKIFLKKAIAINPKSLEYLSELTDIEIIQKNYDAALDLIEKTIKITPNFIAAHVALAKIKTAQGEFDEVFDAAQEIIELDSNTPQGYYYNALALFSQGDVNFAIESLKKAISLDLYNATLYEKMSEFYQQLGNFKMAYDWAKEAADIEEKNYKYKWLCAKLAAKNHNEDEALKWFSQGYRIASFDTKLKTEYADYLKSVGKEKQAEKLLK